MAITRIATDIIVFGYRLVGLLSPNTELEGWKVTEGLRLLNFLLDDLSSASTNLPIFDILEFDLTAGKYVYTVGKDGQDIDSRPITLVQNACIIESNRIYQMKIANYDMFYTDGVNFSSRSRPYYILLEKRVDESQLSFFPVPERTYSVKLRLKKHFDLIEEQTVLNELPVYAHRYLMYALGRILASMNNRTWDNKSEQEYTRLFNQIRANANVDLSVDRDVPFDWGGYGYRGRGRCLSY